MTVPPVGAPARVRIPSLATRSARAWVVATVVAAVAAILVAAATQPDARVPALVGAVVVVLVAVLLLSGRREIDLAARTLVWRRWCWPRTTLARTAIRSVALVPNGAGVLNLELRTDGRTRRLGVVAQTAYVRTCLPAPALTALADLLDGPPTVSGASTVVGELRRQAAHLAAGGPRESSPLAARTRR